MTNDEFKKLSLADQKLEISRLKAQLEIAEEQLAKINAKNAAEKDVSDGMHQKIAEASADLDRTKALLAAKTTERDSNLAKIAILERENAEQDIAKMLPGITEEQRATYLNLAVKHPDLFLSIVRNMPTANRGAVAAFARSHAPKGDGGDSLAGMLETRDGVDDELLGEIVGAQPVTSAPTIARATATASTGDDLADLVGDGSADDAPVAATHQQEKVTVDDGGDALADLIDGEV